MSAPASSTALRRAITVAQLLDDDALAVKLDLLAGQSGTARLIDHARIQKSGLALAGHYHGIAKSRVQVLGQTELSYLSKLDPPERRSALMGFFALEPCCIVVTSPSTHTATGTPIPDVDAPSSFMGVEIVPELFHCAEATGTPLCLSHERSSVTIMAIHALLDDRLAPRVRLHGVLVDVFGVGLLLMGASGIGKSECALDLIMRGHRLVADDVVECDYRPPGMIFGEPANLLRYHLEVRGLGILNIKDLFGVTAIRQRKRIDVVVRLMEWSRETEYDRLGLDERNHVILGVGIRELGIPVKPGRDMASILEVAARNELLRSAGHDGAREFLQRLEGSVASAPRIEGLRSDTDASIAAQPRFRSVDESSAPPPVRPSAPPPFPRKK